MRLRTLNGAGLCMGAVFEEVSDYQRPESSLPRAAGAAFRCRVTILCLIRDRLIDLFLFQSTPLSDQPAHAAQALSAFMVKAATRDKLTAAQQRFNQLLVRIEWLTAQLQSLQAWSDRHRYVHIQALRETRQQALVLQKNLLMFVHERLHDGEMSDSLTAQQQRIARQQIRYLIAQLASGADPQVQALAELYATEDDEELAQEQAEAAQRLRERIEEALGQPLDNPSLYNTPEEMMAAGMRQWQRQQQADDARKAAKRAARKEKKKSTEPQNSQAQTPLVDAPASLRTIYRQLASALHPDREPDEQERLRKTALMSEVNAAYEKNDLTTLLRLQMQVTHAGVSSTSRMADAQLQAMSILLKEQVTALEDDLDQLQMQLSRELCISVRASADEAVMTLALQRLQADQRHEVDSLSADWRRIQQPAEFKRWLKEQGVWLKQQARDGEG